jgi:flagellar motor component MotA
MFGVCLLVAAFYLGWLDLVRDADQTYIVEAIMVLTLLSINLGRHPDLMKWVGDFLPLLGLTGTVIGFMLAFSGNVTAENMMDPESFKGLVTQMLSGLGTALSTTLVGIIGFMWVEVSRRCLTR